MLPFAMGAIYAVPSGTNPTPIPIAVIKGAGVDFKQEKKYVQGQWRAPIDAGDGPLDVGIKINNADFRASVLQMVLSGTSSATGSVLPVTGEAWTIPTTPFQVTVANGANFVENGGVLDLTTGQWMTRGATATATQVYSVTNAGVYTFNTADAGHNVQIVYSYNGPAVGKTVTFANQTMGPSTGYAVRLYNPRTVNGVVKQAGFDFPNVHFPSLSLAFKSDDFAESNLEGRAIQDTTSTTVFKYYVGE